MADHILGVDGPSVTIPTGVAPSTGGLVLADTYDHVDGINGIRTYGPGDAGFVACISDFPDVDWLDTSGNILTPGLYVLTVLLLSGSLAGASGQYVRANGPTNTQDAIAPLDALLAAQHWPDTGNSGLDIGWTLSYSPADSFPTNTNVQVAVPTTATGWLIEAQTSVTRLAYPA